MIYPLKIQVRFSDLYRLHIQFSPISAVASLSYFHVASAFTTVRFINYWINLQITLALDVLEHVNNSIYLSYFEMARVHYFKELLGVGWDWRKFGIVLVKNEIEYHKSVLLIDEPVITLYTENIGTKSFTLGYELKVNDEIYTKGKSVQVCFDASTQSTIPVPEKMRLALEKIIRE